MSMNEITEQPNQVLAFSCRHCSSYLICNLSVFLIDDYILQYKLTRTHSTRSSVPTIVLNRRLAVLLSLSACNSVLALDCLWLWNYVHLTRCCYQDTCFIQNSLSHPCHLIVQNSISVRLRLHDTLDWKLRDNRENFNIFR